METRSQALIAGERLDELASAMRQMPLTGVAVGSSDRALCADLITTDSDLRWRGRIDTAAQQAADEVTAALQRTARR